MSRHFGAITQNGYVVRDIEAAMRHWVSLGVGPWFYMERAPIERFTFRGQPSEVHISIALANSGTLQIELIQQRNEAPSMYREFLQAGREGLQHIAYWTDDFDRDMRKALALGWRVGQSGEVGADGRFAYFDTEAHPGTVIELSEKSGRKGVMFRRIREASESWDGRDPIRSEWPIKL
jgi:catechol 2,3-dioxygenase-like lactoylglutathione lyase family enzyme